MRHQRGFGVVVFWIGYEMSEKQVQIVYTEDLELINQVIQDPWIKNLSENQTTEFKPFPFEVAAYFAVYVEDEFCGLFTLMAISPIEVELHYLLKKNAVQHSRLISKEVLKFIFANPNVMRITTTIFEDRKIVVNLCLKHGFVYEGFRRKCLQVKGKLIGLHMLGLTREDFEKWAE